MSSVNLMQGNSSTLKLPL